MIVNRTKRTVRVGGEYVALTVGEFDILWFMAGRAGRVVSRDDLYHRVLQMEYDGRNRCLDLRVSRLRKKLGDNRGAPRIIKSIRGEGYLFALSWD